MYFESSSRNPIRFYVSVYYVASRHSWLQYRHVRTGVYN